MKIVLIRHFKTAGNMEKRYVGKTDEDIIGFLPDKRYPPADLVFTSTMKRCRQTAKLIYPSVKWFPAEGFSEMDFGDFEYRNYEELKDDARYQVWLEIGGKQGFPGGEKLNCFTARVKDAFLFSIETAQKAGAKQIAFVVHGGTIMALLSEFGGGDFYDYQVSPGDGYLCLFSGGKLAVLGEL